MNKTDETLEASAEQKEFESGISSAKEALSRTDNPILLMDELPGLSLEPDVFAMGWNSVWASTENRERLEAILQERKKE